MLPAIKKILYATDLSPNAVYAFGYAVSIAQQYGAELTILHVLEEMTAKAYLQIESYIGVDQWRLLQEEKQAELIQEIKTRIKQRCAQVGSDAPACRIDESGIVVRSGQPVETILDTATEQEVDLIVMGTRGFGAVTDALIGGTARRVVRRSTKPVMVVRLPENQA